MPPVYTKFFHGADMPSSLMTTPPRAASTWRPPSTMTLNSGPPSRTSATITRAQMNAGPNDNDGENILNYVNHASIFMEDVDDPHSNSPGMDGASGDGNGMGMGPGNSTGSGGDGIPKQPTGPDSIITSIVFIPGQETIISGPTTVTSQPSGSGKQSGNAKQDGIPAWVAGVIIAGGSLLVVIIMGMVLYHRRKRRHIRAGFHEIQYAASETVHSTVVIVPKPSLDDELTPTNGENLGANENTRLSTLWENPFEEDEVERVSQDPRRHSDTIPAARRQEKTPINHDGQQSSDRYSGETAPPSYRSQPTN